MNTPWTPSASSVPTLRLADYNHGQKEEEDPYFESKVVIVVWDDTLAFARLVLDPEEMTLIWVLDPFHPGDFKVPEGSGVPFENIAYWMPLPTPPHTLHRAKAGKIPQKRKRAGAR